MGLDTVILARCEQIRNAPEKHRVYIGCGRCDARIRVEDEVECHFCHSAHCTECDLRHFCGDTNTCSLCEKRFPASQLTLLPCACDEELCPGCLAAHCCPPTFKQALDAWDHELAAQIVGEK